MKYVIHTQFRENYGAHDWNGRGECPQYWKFKGGDTYVVEVSLAEAQDPLWYAAVAACIEHSSDYSEEYIVHSDLVDEVDYDPATVCEEWERPIMARLSIDGHLNCERELLSYDLTNTPKGVRSWRQDHNGARDISLVEYEAA